MATGKYKFYRVYLNYTDTSGVSHTLDYNITLWFDDAAGGYPSPDGGGTPYPVPDWNWDYNTDRLTSAFTIYANEITVVYVGDVILA